MNKSILIIASITIVALGAYIIGEQTSGGFEDACSNSCEMTAGSFNARMSICCERACAAKNVVASTVVAQSTAKVGDYARCPVSGVVFLVDGRSSKVSFEQKTAYTCCASCAGIFNSDPREYAHNIH